MEKGGRLLLAEEVSVLNRFGGVHVTSGYKTRDFNSDASGRALK